MMPRAESMPWLGLYPTMPQNAAGRTTEPLVWVPIAAGTNPAATAAAEPLEEPPGVCLAFQGLVVFAATRPAHVNLAEALILPTDQAGATQVHRREG